MTTAPEPASQSALRPVRGIGLGGGLAANILNMVGIGPFITIPLAISAMGGPQAMLGWLLGAVLCAYDGLVWAELGSAFPRSGGPYHYLLHAFGPARLGRLFSFLYLWQSLLIGPLSIASGTVGLAQYASFLAPEMKPWHMMAIAAAVCLVNTALLYRDIRSIQRLSIAITVVVVAACLWIVFSGALHFDARLAFDFPEGAFKPTGAFWMGMGSATLIAVYDYGGYNNVCMIGEEIKNPGRIIPRAVLLSIAIVALLYLGLNLSILGTLPWQTAQKSGAVVADFMQVIYGHWGGVVVSVLILIASWGSALVVLLGFSRVPYTAAVDGRFFKPFARLHPTGRFPTVSLLFMGVASAIACFFSLADLIAVLIVIQTLFQFTAQCVAVVMLRRQGAAVPGQFRMPLYPLPVIITIAGWLYIVATSQPRHIAIGIGMLALGVAIYLVQSRREGAWPFRVPAWRAP
ncbi:amino acid/polyamine/organocation transporter (APC superfamily) [Nitrospirillum amazonense]|uniref:Amino acid/polyamine/organocation transporter (APC superfamily) n=1 Tax=Nitrospirillum amazonense TaxID=28077 RepID=A0A560EWG7_9PROT|nr:APC family permease [Nitrospirillum amazonense]TWB13711.1 amino acid/polyamine/organocation transporter (APC superfamily) [Nitrospirillum amazonense]